MGIGGSGISGVSFIASKMGYDVSGCDLEGSTSYIKDVVKGHSSSHVKDADLVVASPAVYYQNSNHPEFVRAKKEGKLMTWEEFLGKYLAKGKKLIAICGTHGKSTTTAMVGKLLVDAGLDPIVVLGAKVPEWSGNSRFGQGKYFVVEADEFFDNFLNYTPDIVILNNIEFDHPDYFKNEDEVYMSFKRFIDNLTGEKILIANSDDRGVINIIDGLRSDLKIIKYFRNKKDNPELKLSVMGDHNYQNALGVYELARVLNIDMDQALSSLESFKGISRRLEKVFDKNGVVVYDDYAHHPTAVAKTIEALRLSYPKNRMWVIVEPHGYLRTKELIAKYKGVFSNADEVIIGPIFKARDKRISGVTPKLVAKNSGHNSIKALDSFDKIRKEVKSKIKVGDVILVMGAGKSYLWAKNLLT